ncbi:GNAT family N-acetyltransferase [Spirosoma aerolatum]|uniref:GNAT family N-acetyltransferase n=1 Tax=Spirosoma aerolatum TaxID=1211326 RepID=UPI0009AE579E|nr:GNAT family N-acetyltransferase [Spirosoma aerolatum]
MLNNISTSFPILTSKRLTLRQPLESDAQHLFLLRSDISVNKYLDRQPTETVEEVVSFIRKVNENFKNGTGIYWVIIQAGNEKVIGAICLFNFSYELKKCEIGYELLSNYQGKGIMNEALKKIIGFTFKTLKFETIDAFVHKGNQRSTKLLRKLNFKEMIGIEEASSTLVQFSLSN